MSSPRPLLLVGAGGLAREAVEAVRAANAVTPTWEVLGHLDDDEARHGTRIGAHPVLGPVDAVADHPDAAVLLCTGRPTDQGSRHRLVDRLGLAAERYATVVHPAAVVPPGARLGRGTLVLATTVLTEQITVGDHVVLMPGVVLTHDVVVEDFATFGAGVRLGGGVRVGTAAYLGSGALVREQLTIGAWALVGMGAVVTRDVPAGETWVGSPARRLRTSATGADPPAPRRPLVADRH